MPATRQDEKVILQFFQSRFPNAASMKVNPSPYSHKVVVEVEFVPGKDPLAYMEDFPSAGWDEFHKSLKEHTAYYMVEAGSVEFSKGGGLDEYFFYLYPIEEEVKVPRYLYHFTSPSLLKSILQNGLWSPRGGVYVFSEPSMETLDSIVEGYYHTEEQSRWKDWALLKIDTHYLDPYSFLAKDKEFIEDGIFWVEGGIPADAIVDVREIHVTDMKEDTPKRKRFRDRSRSLPRFESSTNTETSGVQKEAWHILTSRPSPESLLAKVKRGDIEAAIELALGIGRGFYPQGKFVRGYGSPFWYPFSNMFPLVFGWPLMGDFRNMEEEARRRISQGIPGDREQVSLLGQVEEISDGIVERYSLLNQLHHNMITGKDSALEDVQEVRDIWKWMHEAYPKFKEALEELIKQYPWHYPRRSFDHMLRFRRYS